MKLAALLALPLAGCATYPEVAPGVLETAGARYRCSDGSAFTARFAPAGDAATLTFDDTTPDLSDGYAQDRQFQVALTSQRPASGIWYAGGGWSLRGKGDAADLSRPDGRTATCRAGDSLVDRRDEV